MLADKRILAERIQPPTTAHDESEGVEHLLEVYLTLPYKQREQRFADTARAAQITGLTQRTIQLWIEFGTIRAVPIGRKYKIDLVSLKDYLKSRAELKAFW